jgi:hypothetical protein
VLIPVRPIVGCDLTLGATMHTSFYRLPRAARALITAAAFVAAMLGVSQLYALDNRSDSFYGSVNTQLVLAAVTGLLVGVLTVVVGDRRIRRIYGTTEQAITYSRALRTGQLPTHIEPAAWQRWIDVSRKSIRTTPTTVAIFAVLAVLQGVGGHHWVVASLFVLLGIWLLVVRWVLRRRILRLTSAIDQRGRALG